MLRVLAPAKINLCLKITGTLPGGFHALQTVFQQVGLHDELMVERCRARGLFLTVESAVGHTRILSRRNILHAAFEAIARRRGLVGGLSVHLRKRIPVGAGLGGGSSDAAALIRAANLLYGLRLSRRQEQAIGAVVGSDVPFFLRGGCALGLGRGERVTPVASRMRFWIVLVYPRIRLSTPYVYGLYDRCSGRPAGRQQATNAKKLTLLQNIIKIQYYLKNNMRRALADVIHNDLQPVVCAAYPRIARLLERCRSLGADAAAVSGSGSSLYALFFDAARAAACHAALVGSRDCGLWLVQSETDGIAVAE